MNETISLSVRLRPSIAALPPYQQGKASSADAFKLSSNENPFGPLPVVLEAVRAISDFNRYPDTSAMQLRTILAERFGVGIDQVHLGAGSVSILTQLITAAAEAGDEVVYSWRSFEAYPGLAVIAGATGVAVLNRADHGHDLDAMAAAINDRTRVVIVCSPNNPTSSIVTKAEFEAFMTKVPADLMVVLDEAYVEFVTDEDAVDGLLLLDRYPNLVVLRTFSKAYGLAGLRLGYAVGPVAILDAARAAQIPLSTTTQAQVAAVTSLQHESEIMERVSRLVIRRDELWHDLLKQGWNMSRPHGNFLWFATGEQTNAAAAVFNSHGIVVRPFPPDGIRASIGEPESVDKLRAAAKEIVDALPAGHPGRRLD